MKKSLAISLQMLLLPLLCVAGDADVPGLLGGIFPLRQDTTVVGQYVNPGRSSADNRNGRTPLFIGLKLAGGQVLQTNDFVRGDNRIPFYGNSSLKFGMSSVGNRWQDIAYGMPYYGIAFYTADFGRRDDMGRPWTVYLLQGATITRVSKRLLLNYEWNLGMSMGWKYYDPFDNPHNIALGSENNVHVGYNIYLKWTMTRDLDLHFGIDLTHSSNGAQRLPNAGLNMYSVFVEGVANFNRKGALEQYDPMLLPPKYDKHTASEVLLTLSSRQTDVDTTGTNLPTKYLARKFRVLGFSYSFLKAPNYRYCYGISADLLYDESAGVTAWREINPYDNRSYDRVKLGRGKERFSMGLSARGEVLLPGYTIFANVGYQLIHGNKRDKRLYQILGVKIYLKENFFGTFGIRATHFSKAQFLFWSLGYTLDHNRRDRAGRQSD